MLQSIIIFYSCREHANNNTTTVVTAHDTEKFKRLGWKVFVEQCRANSDFSSLDNVHHPAQRLLEFYEQWGALVTFTSKSWSHNQIIITLAHGAHKSYYEHLEFLHEEFTDIIKKGQWVAPLPVMSRTC